MNKKQRMAVIFGIAIICGMLLISPYKSTYNRGQFVGFGLITNPGKRFMASTDGITRLSGGTVEIDVIVLTVQCVFIIALTGGLVVLSNQDMSGPRR